MVPPARMLATKNRAAPRAVFLLAFSVLLAGCGPPGPRALLEGRRLLDAGRYPQAVEQLKRAASLLRTNAQAWNDLGVAYHRAGQASNAMTAYATALKCDQNLAEARFNLGCLWLEQNRPDLAAEQFTSYTLQRGQAVEGFLKLGTAQLRARQTAAAEQSFSKALRLRAHDPEALNGLGLAQLQRNRPRDAVRYFNAALEHHPGYRPALLNLATVLHRHLNDPAAVQKYREYLALKPRPPDWDAVNAIVQSLERPVPPPSRPTPAVAEAPATVATNPVEKPPVARAPAPVKTSPPPAVATSPSPPPVVSSPPPPPPATVVTLPPEPVIKTAPDTSPPAPQPETAAAPPVSSAATVGASAPPPAKRGFFSRLNPFHREPAAKAKAAPLPAGTVEPSPTLPSPSPAAATVGVVTTARYAYLAPAVPPAGDRAAAERAFAQGTQLQRANRLNEAAAAYKQAAQLDGSYFEAHYNLGLVAYETRNYRQSLTEWEYALAIRPDSVDARFNFALALRAANYPRDAAKELEKILAANPGETRAHLVLGSLYAEALHDPARARVHYLKVLELDPRHPQATAIRYWLVANPS
jgi:tetratricopeptide (TPR) repeat protein